MAYQIDPTKPRVMFDILELEKQAAAVFDSLGITNDTQRANTVNALTAGSAGELLIVKMIANSMKLTGP